VIYLDTGCFVKLYYPEPDSVQVVAKVQGKPMCYTLLHELEFVNALQLKVFLNSATPKQVTAARGLVQADLKSSTLVSVGTDWPDISAKLLNWQSSIQARSVVVRWIFSTAPPQKCSPPQNSSAQIPVKRNWPLPWV